MTNIFRTAILAMAMMISASFAWGQNSENAAGPVQDIAHIEFVNLSAAGCGNGWTWGWVYVKFIQPTYSYEVNPGYLCCYSSYYYLEIKGDLVGYFSDVEITTVLYNDLTNKTFSYTYRGPFTTKGNPAVINGNSFNKLVDCLEAHEIPDYPANPY